MSGSGTWCASRPAPGEATRPGRMAWRSSSSARPTSGRTRAGTSRAGATGGPARSAAGSVAGGGEVLVVFGVPGPGPAPAPAGGAEDVDGVGGDHARTVVGAVEVRAGGRVPALAAADVRVLG